MAYKTKKTSDDFDRSDRPSKRDFTASTISILQKEADDGVVEYFECTNDPDELKKALERGERPSLLFVPFDSPEANRNARADIYALYMKNGVKIFTGIECKATDYKFDMKEKVEEGVFCDKKKMAFFREMYRVYGIPYYWAELYNVQKKIRIWNLKKMGVLTGERKLEDLTKLMPEVSIDPDSPKKLTTKGGLPVEEAKVIDRIKGDNVYDQQRDSGRTFRLG